MSLLQKTVKEVGSYVLRLVVMNGVLQNWQFICSDGEIQLCVQMCCSTQDQLHCAV